MKKRILILLILLLLPFSISFAGEELLGHVLYYRTTDARGNSYTKVITSPSGAGWQPGYRCGAHFTKKEGINWLDKPNNIGDGCGVCYALYDSRYSVTSYNNNSLQDWMLADLCDATAIRNKITGQTNTVKEAIAEAFGISDLTTISFDQHIDYWCSNKSIYMVCNVYKVTTDYVTLKVTGPQENPLTGTVTINGEATSEKTFIKDSWAKIEFTPWPGHTVTNATWNGQAVRKNENQTYFPCDIYMGENITVEITTAEQPIIPRVYIYDKNGNFANDAMLPEGQTTVTIKDGSTYFDNLLDGEIPYSGNNRLWQIWDDSIGNFRTLYRDEIYNDGDTTTPVTAESFEVDIPTDNKWYTYRVIHYRVYDHAVTLPIDNSNHAYAIAKVTASTNLDPRDFKIFYNPSGSNTLQDVTDKTWSNTNAFLTVQLIPDNLAELDVSKISWETPNEGITINANTDGTASALISSGPVYNFTMYYNGTPAEHHTAFNNSPPPRFSDSEFKIKHNSDDVTDIQWESPTDHQQVTLTPDKLNQNSYYWEYTDATQTTWAPLPNGEENKKEPNFKVSYNENYTFRLTVNRGTARESSTTHITYMMPPIINNPSNVDVDVTLSSPTKRNIHNIPLGEDVYLTPITIRLSPQPQNGFVLDDTWHWQVWLTGHRVDQTQYLLINADSYDNQNPSAYNYETKSDTQYGNIPNGMYFTYESLPYNTTVVTIPYWRTAREEGKIIFNVYARLVCDDGRISDYDNYTTSTLLVDNSTITASGEEFKEYITSIDELYPEYPSDNAAIVEAGSTIPFSADISQTNSISITTQRNILSPLEYSNSGSETNFKANLQLNSTGDYDEGKNYNLLTITGHNINGTHTATQELKIQPNWYIDPPTGGSPTSALKIKSVRDLRWQTLYNRPNDFDAPTTFGLKENFGDKNLLSSVYLNNATGYSKNNNGGIDISKLKTGYAVEFELKVTDVFANYLKNDRNAKITIKTNANSLGLTYPQGNLADYSIIELSRKTAEDSTYRFQVKQLDNYKTWRFVYYLPPTVKSNTGKTEATLKFTEITADNNKGSTFNWMNLVNSSTTGLRYNWQGKVFTYDLTKNNLQDLGNNAN